MELRKAHKNELTFLQHCHDTVIKYLKKQKSNLDGISAHEYFINSITNRSLTLMYICKSCKRIISIQKKKKEGAGNSISNANAEHNDTTKASKTRNDSSFFSFNDKSKTPTTKDSSDNLQRPEQHTPNKRKMDLSDKKSISSLINNLNKYMKEKTPTTKIPTEEQKEDNSYIGFIICSFSKLNEESILFKSRSRTKRTGTGIEKHKTHDGNYKANPEEEKSNIVNPANQATSNMTDSGKERQDQRESKNSFQSYSDNKTDQSSTMYRNKYNLNNSFSQNIPNKQESRSESRENVKRESSVGNEKTNSRQNYPNVQSKSNLKEEREKISKILEEYVVK